jgi:hypothetical protein
MSWDVIDNVKPKYASAMKVPDNGVAVSARTLGARGGRKVKWIAITLGAETARKLSLLQPEVRVRLLLGGGQRRGQDRDIGRRDQRPLSGQAAEKRLLSDRHQRGERRRAVRHDVRAVYPRTSGGRAACQWPAAHDRLSRRSGHAGCGR